jgi:hypothetical protein
MRDGSDCSDKVHDGDMIFHEEVGAYSSVVKLAVVLELFTDQDIH